jgi:two-component system, cell cycle sensor histidine kinase and response regulator CckA
MVVGSTPWSHRRRPEPVHLLVIENDQDDYVRLQRALASSAHELVCRRVETEPEFREALEDTRWDAVIAAYRNPHLDGLTALRIIKDRGLDLPFLVVSAEGGEESAVEAMKAGAHDYLAKDRLQRLVPALERELREARVRRDRDRLEDDLRQAQKMEAVGRLAGGISHDFNNLLTAIRGYADLALGELPADHPIRADVAEIIRASDRATDLTGQLLAFGRRQIVTPRVHDLNDLVARTELLLRRVIGEHIDLSTSFVPEHGYVRVDAGQVEQVLVNLALNARDAMQAGGRLLLETRLVDLDASYRDRHGSIASGRYVQLSVSDNGRGMDAETRARAFEPFFTTKPHGVGTGLGLSTVYGIVTQSSGHVWLYSEPGAGTIVRIYLPRIADSEAERALVPPTPVPGGTEKVLLVEDEATVRVLAREVLLRRGYDVVEAADAQHALDIVAEHGASFAVVVTDVVMPGMTGPELVARLREDQAALRVLYMSGYADESAAHRLIEDSRSAYLQKPFSPDTLSRKVRDVLDSPVDPVE